MADREGRFRWQPRILKLDILPFDEVDFSLVLDTLANHEWIEKYTVEGEVYGVIPKFLAHQRPNTREAASILPPPPCTRTHVQDNAIHAQKPGEGEGERIKGKGKGVAPEAPHVQDNAIHAHAPEIMNGPKPPEPGRPAFQHLSYRFYLVRLKLGDEYYDPWDEKYLSICKTICEKRARNNFEEVNKRLVHLLAWNHVEPNFYKVTPMDLSSKWVDMANPPNLEGRRFGELKKMVYEKRADQIREGIQNGGIKAE